MTYGQEVKMNETLKIYEYTHVKEFDGGIESRLELFDEKMQELNYSGTEKSDDGIKGENFFTKMINGDDLADVRALRTFRERTLQTSPTPRTLRSSQSARRAQTSATLSSSY